MKIALIGGHVTPAMAVIEELQQMKKAPQIVYFGRAYSFEGKKVISNDHRIISKLPGVKYYDLDSGRLQRRWSRYTLLSLFKIPYGFWQAYKILKIEEPDLILSFGGYLSVPVAIVGFFMKIPLILHEQTVSVGLSNRINSFIAQKILLTWEQSQANFPAHKCIVVGNPIRRSLLKPTKANFKQMPERLQQIVVSKIQNKDQKLVYITGGNQGSYIINQTTWQILPELLKQTAIVHQCGAFDFQRLSAQEKEDLNFEQYFYTDWLDETSVGIIMQLSDIVVARAGANTVYELAALGKPAIFIPIPWVVDNEQMKNAEILVNAGFAKIVSENTLKPWQLKQAIEEMFHNIEEYRGKGEEYKRIIQKDAAAKIVKIINDLLVAKK